jgi:adenylate cyclase
MEGLTKTYKSEILITEYVRAQIELSGGPNAKSGAALPYRLLDKVAVKGKNEGVRIYTVKRALQGGEEKAWAFHNQGMELYFRRDFAGALRRFEEALALLPGDYNASKLLERCKAYGASPPPRDWDGTEIMHTK